MSMSMSNQSNRFVKLMEAVIGACSPKGRIDSNESRAKFKFELEFEPSMSAIRCNSWPSVVRMLNLHHKIYICRIKTTNNTKFYLRASIVCVNFCNSILRYSHHWPHWNKLRTKTNKHKDILRQHLPTPLRASIIARMPLDPPFSRFFFCFSKTTSNE